MEEKINKIKVRTRMLILRKTGNDCYSIAKKSNLVSFRWNLLIFLLITAIMSGLMTNNVCAIGITPGKISLEYKEGLVEDKSISIINNEQKKMKVLVMVQGELNNSVKIFQNFFEFLPEEGSKQLNLRISLDSSIKNIPGEHNVEIIALEIPEFDQDQGFVGATVSVSSSINVKVACPGKCIESDLSIFDSEENSTATFIVPVVSRGELGIGDVRAVIDVYSPMMEKVATVQTESKPLASKQKIELIGKWEVDVGPGQYLAKASVIYDNNNKVIEKQFTVGSQALSIEEIRVNNFRLGEIAKLLILVENRWNQELENVIANLIIFNKNDQVMTDIRSSGEKIRPLEKKELVMYWDTVGVKEGEYNGKLIVRYKDRSSDKNLRLKVSDDNLDVFGVGYTIQPKGGKGGDIVFILIVIVVILLVVNLMWFILFKRFSDRGRSKANENIKLRKK